MSKLKHTPGPWTTDGTYIEDYDNNCLCRRRIAIIDNGAGIDNPEANAHLIAAAPEMLEVLIEDLKQNLYHMNELDIKFMRENTESKFNKKIDLIEKATSLTIEEVLNAEN